MQQSQSHEEFHSYVMKSDFLVGVFFIVIIISRAFSCVHVSSLGTIVINYTPFVGMFQFLLFYRSTKLQPRKRFLIAISSDSSERCFLGIDDSSTL